MGIEVGVAPGVELRNEEAELLLHVEHLGTVERVEDQRQGVHAVGERRVIEDAEGQRLPVLGLAHDARLDVAHLDLLDQVQEAARRRDVRADLDRSGGGELVHLGHLAHDLGTGMDEGDHRGAVEIGEGDVRFGNTQVGNLHDQLRRALIDDLPFHRVETHVQNPVEARTEEDDLVTHGERFGIGRDLGRRIGIGEDFGAPGRAVGALERDGARAARRGGAQDDLVARDRVPDLHLGIVDVGLFDTVQPGTAHRDERPDRTRRRREGSDGGSLLIVGRNLQLLVARDRQQEHSDQ